MALYPVPTRLMHRRRTFDEWYALNEVLLAGEEGFETHDATGAPNDPWKCKVGDGTTPWNDLEYLDEGSPTPGGADMPAVMARISLGF